MTRPGPPAGPPPPPADEPTEPAEPAEAPPAAPVATERGMFGTPPAPFIAYDDPDSGGLRRVALWVLALAFAATVSGWLVLLSAAQATSEPVALPLHERAVAALTEIDALLDLHVETLQQQADTGAERLAVPGYPVRDATVAAERVIDASGDIDRDLLRAELLATSARLVYARGVDAFGEIPGEQDEAPVAPRLLSRSGGMRAMLDWLTSGRHSTAVVLLWPLGLAALVLGGLVVWTARGFGRFIAPGLALVAAAVPLLAGVLAMRLALSFVAGGPDDELFDAFVTLARELTRLPLHNALWTAGAGLAVVLPAALLDALFARSVRRPAGVDGV